MKYLKGIMIFLAVLLCSLLLSISAYAYTYPYNPETGFEVPYTIITKDELSEPEYAVGEVHEGSSSEKMRLLLPNGNTLCANLPYIIEYVTNAEMQYLISPSYAAEYNDNGDKIHDYPLYLYDLDSSYKRPMSSHEETLYLLSTYKGNFFAYPCYNSSSAVMQLDPNTFEQIDRFPEDGIYPFETEIKTLYESKGGFEICPGSYVRKVIPAAGRYARHYNSYMLSHEKTFEYSCDGYYYMKVNNQSTLTGSVIHAIVNDEDCICIGYDDKYCAFKRSDLELCWREFTQDAPYVHLNETRLIFDRPPIIEDGITLMPLRFLLETSGAVVNWDEGTKSALISYGDTNIVISDGNSTAYINGEAFTLDKAARIIDGKMMIPLRFVSEGLGFELNWDAETSTVNLKTPTNGSDRRVSVFSPITNNSIKVMLNGKEIPALNSDGNTFINIQLLLNSPEIYITKLKEISFDLSDIGSNEEEYVEIKNYYTTIKNGYIYRSDTKVTIDSMPIAMYTTNSLADNLTFTTVTPSGRSSMSCAGRLLCVEEAADMLDSLHYEWIAEENTLYVYISDDMVTFDDALKMILDKKGIDHNTPYKGDAYKDIEIMQKYSDNDLSSLVNAGITVGAISESDCADGILRPTRNISHLDLKRMLNGMGYDYTYDYESANKPVTQSEFNAVLEEL